jgi:hypothetical protein
MENIGSCLSYGVEGGLDFPFDSGTEGHEFLPAGYGGRDGLSQFPHNADLAVVAGDLRHTGVGLRLQVFFFEESVCCCHGLI